MPEKEKPEEKSKRKEKEKMQEMREKVQEMQRMRGPGQMPAQMGPSSLMQRMASMRGGQQNRAMIETVKGLRTDMKEIKDYLKKILEALKQK